MRNTYNFKIKGSGPTGLLLSIALSNLDVNVYITDLLSRRKIIEKDKTYAITHSTRKILEKFNIWNKLNPYLYGFDTLSIFDSVTSASTILRNSDLDNDLKSSNNIGWVIKHSDLMNVFFKEIDENKNIFFKSPAELSQEKISFDYDFISTGAKTKIKKSFFDSFSFSKTYNQSCLTFKVLMRGNFKGRAYEIFRKEGPLALLPLDRNLYQIIWTSSNSKSADRLNANKNFLIDNLNTILPENFKLDQIIGDVNLFPISLSLNFSKFNLERSVFLGDSFHTFHPVGGQGLNTCWRDVNCIFDIFNKNINTRRFNFSLFKFKYYLSRILDVLSIIVITDLLIRLFANRNFILFPIRKLSFLLLNKFIFVRKIVLNQMTKSLIFSSIK